MVEVARRVGAAVGLLVVQMAAAAGAAGAAMAAGAAVGAVACFHDLLEPELGFPQRHAYHDVFLLLS